jgi:hypothetical protein
MISHELGFSTEMKIRFPVGHAGLAMLREKAFSGLQADDFWSV